MRILTFTALLALLGCASQNGAGTAAPAASHAAVAKAASTPATAVAADAAPNAVFQPPREYKRRPDLGENVYCAKITVLGSRFPKEDCRTEAELRDLEMQRASDRGEIEQRRGVCAGAGACQSQ